MYFCWDWGKRWSANFIPYGLQLNQFDAIQKELVKIAHLISPYYCTISCNCQIETKVNIGEIEVRVSFPNQCV